MWRILILALMLATPLWAVQPDEILPDPVQESRARDISQGLRCLVCRNESIDDSNAGLAKDLRLLVRERIVAGDTDDEVREFVVARFGEYVLLNPKVDGSNLLLWGAGPLMLLAAGAVGLFSRRRRGRSPDQQLSAAEKARLAELLKD